MIRMHEGRFTVYVPPDPLARLNIFDVIEDGSGRHLDGDAGRAGGTARRPFRIVVPAEGMLATAVVTLCASPRRRHLGRHLRQGLMAGSGRRTRSTSPRPTGWRATQIRSLLSGGRRHALDRHVRAEAWLLRNGKFQKFTAADGLLSDNIADISADAESLWLSTTRGICRVAAQATGGVRGAPAEDF